jgi:RecA-family ATPase
MMTTMMMMGCSARARARGFLLLGDWKKMEKWKTLHSSGKRRVVSILARVTTTTTHTRARTHKERLERSREEGYE